MEMKKVKQIATFEYNRAHHKRRNSNPCSGVPKITQLFNRGFCFFFIRPSSSFFWKNAKLKRNPLLLLSTGRKEENIGFKSVWGWWVIVWGYFPQPECLYLS